MADPRRRHQQYRNAKRRAEAITFLSNISLNGGAERRRRDGHHSKDGKTGLLAGENETKEEDGTVLIECGGNVGAVNSNTDRKRNSHIAIGQQKTSPTHIHSSIISMTSSPSLLLHTQTLFHESPSGGSSATAKIRRTLSQVSAPRTRRTSGGPTPPSSPIKAGGERFFLNKTISGDNGRYRFQKQVPSDPHMVSSSHSSSEDIYHFVSSKKLFNLESPPEGAELDFSKSKSARLCNSGGRIIMVSQNKAPFAIFSHLRYNRTSQLGQQYRRESEIFNTSYRARGGSVVRPRLSDQEEFHSNMTILDGVELGGAGKTVSYSHMLVPCLLSPGAMGHRKLGVTDALLISQPVKAPPQIISMSCQRSPDRDNDLNLDHKYQLPIYDPNKLDDPELTAGKHKKLFQFPSYRVSIIDYAKPSALKRELNEKFRAMYPKIELTLSKLRSIKREMKKIVLEECDQDPGMLAQAYVYFEKLVFYQKINKDNRKMLAGVCLLLSAKLNDVKGTELQSLVKEIEDTFRESKKDLFAFEFPVLVALEFALHIPEYEVMPHYKRLMQT